MATLESLQAKIAKLQVQAEAIAKKDSSAVLEKISELMSKHGLTTADIDAHTGGKKRGPKPGAKAAVKAGASTAKYQNPKTGATWTGHGRAPAWVANAKDRTKFLIDATGATASKPKVSAKAPGKAAAKGKLPPKYINRKTGETWSGHARPPAWLKDVKDRSKFLITGGAEATVAATANAVSKAKASAKKGASKSSGATGGKGQPKGAQPALYRDPKSGSTWSGRGRAPAWLASVKDRSKFLIDGAGVAADAGVSTKTEPAAKKAVAKQAVAKKVAATKVALTKKAAVKKTAAEKTMNAKAPAKKAPAKKAATSVKKAPEKKTPRNSVTVTAPVATVESGAESTT
ncbi:H-NS family nucleoid-associated regulatory protein [Paraburkholderia terrae]